MRDEPEDLPRIGCLGAPLASEGMLPLPWALAPWQEEQCCSYSSRPAAAFFLPESGFFRAAVEAGALWKLWATAGIAATSALTAIIE
jgi:hypothetical protein